MSPTYEQLELPLPAAAPPFDARSGPNGRSPGHAASATRWHCSRTWPPLAAAPSIARRARVRVPRTAPRVGVARRLFPWHGPERDRPSCWVVPAPLELPRGWSHRGAEDSAAIPIRRCCVSRCRRYWMSDRIPTGRAAPAELWCTRLSVCQLLGERERSRQRITEGGADCRASRSRTPPSVAVESISAARWNT